MNRTCTNCSQLKQSTFSYGTTHIMVEVSINQCGNLLMTGRLGIRMRIRCLTWSTWKFQSGEAVFRLSVHESASEVSRSGGDAQVVSHHRYLVVFRPFVEQFLISMPSCDGILSGTCQKVRKLCINPYISIINPLGQTYIQS